MNIDDTFTQLLYSTAPIWVELADGTQRSGTAFFYMSPLPNSESQGIPLLVTNFHTVKDCKRALTQLVLKSDGKPSDKTIKVELEPKFVLQHSNTDLDLVVMPIGPMLNQLENSETPVFIRTVTKDLISSKEELQNLSAVEDITFIGYPSGLFDRKNMTPIVRRGITATPVWSDFNGENKFLIDAGVFPGSSGSPVFIANSGGFNTSKGFTVGSRLIFLGVLVESFVRKSENNVYLGLGKALLASELANFCDKIVEYELMSNNFSDDGKSNNRVL